jgi:hypothetical protein
MAEETRLSGPTRWWLVAVALGGLGFGLIAERRPFGDGFFAHPLVAFCILVGLGLIVLRAALARPVPEIIPERALAFGCFAGLTMFLLGNWIGVHLLAAR